MTEARVNRAIQEIDLLIEYQADLAAEVGLLREIAAAAEESTTTTGAKFTYAQTKLRRALERWRKSQAVSLRNNVVSQEEK